MRLDPWVLVTVAAASVLWPAGAAWAATRSEIYRVTVSSRCSADGTACVELTKPLVFDMTVTFDDVVLASTSLPDLEQRTFGDVSFSAVPVPAPSPMETGVAPLKTAMALAFVRNSRRGTSLWREADIRYDASEDWFSFDSWVHHRQIRLSYTESSAPAPARLPVPSVGDLLGRLTTSHFEYLDGWRFQPDSWSADSYLYKGTALADAFDPVKDGFRFVNDASKVTVWYEILNMLGNCTGMSYAALYYWYLGFPPGLGVDQPAEDAPEWRYIEHLQRRKGLAQVPVWLGLALSPFISADVAQHYATIKNTIAATRRPVPVLLAADSDARFVHTVLAYRVDEATTTRRVLVYDPNLPAQQYRRGGCEIVLESNGADWTMSAYTCNVTGATFTRFAPARPAFDVTDLPLAFALHSPGTLKVIDPAGLVTIDGITEVPAARFWRENIDDDDDMEQIVAFAQPKAGGYIVQVIPDAAAPASARFSLTAHNFGVASTLADQIPIAQADPDGYDFAAAAVPPSDTEPPQIIAIEPTVSVLWPPNGRMVPVHFRVTAIDDSGAAPACSVTSVTANDGGPGDRVVSGPLSVLLRAERAGHSGARIYSVAVQCSDGSGNTAANAIQITVPHDRRK